MPSRMLRVKFMFSRAPKLNEFSFLPEWKRRNCRKSFFVNCNCKIIKDLNDLKFNLLIWIHFHLWLGSSCHLGEQERFNKKGVDLVEPEISVIIMFTEIVSSFRGKWNLALGFYVIIGKRQLSLLFFRSNVFVSSGNKTWKLQNAIGL